MTFPGLPDEDLGLWLRNSTGELSAPYGQMLSLGPQAVRGAVAGRVLRIDPPRGSPHAATW